MSVGNVISKGVGAAALFFIARDAHVWGKIRADENMKTKNAKAAAYYMNNAMTLDKLSITKSKMQDAVYRFELNENIRGSVNSTHGYIKGFFASMVSNVIPLALGVVALCTKGKASAASAIGLAGLGVYTFIKDGLGYGKNKDMTLPTE